MDKNKRTAADLITIAGTLMTISGALMALNGRVSIGGVFWVSACCMFLAAYLFRKAKEQPESEESEIRDEKSL